MTHTPGPWVVVLGHPENACAYIREAHSPDNFAAEVAVIYACDRDNEARDANACLIAAAPELLEYIEWHLYDLKHGYTDTGRTTNIAALVAKIRGEP